MTQAGAETRSWYLQLIEGIHFKFYRITVVGNQLTTHWGRIGTAGQMQVKNFGSFSRACSEANRKLAEKRSKGYDYEVDPQAPARPTTPVAAPASQRNQAPTPAPTPEPAPVAAKAEPEPKPTSQKLSSGFVLFFD